MAAERKNGARAGDTLLLATARERRTRLTPLGSSIPLDALAPVGECLAVAGRIGEQPFPIAIGWRVRTGGAIGTGDRQRS